MDKQEEILNELMKAEIIEFYCKNDSEKRESGMTTVGDWLVKRTKESNGFHQRAQPVVICRRVQSGPYDYGYQEV